MSGGFPNAAVDFRPTLNGDQRRELLYEAWWTTLLTSRWQTLPAMQTVRLRGKYASGLHGAYRLEKGTTSYRIQQDYEASVSGGNEKTTFYASLACNSQEGTGQEPSLDPLLRPSEHDPEGRAVRWGRRQHDVYPDEPGDERRAALPSTRICVWQWPRLLPCWWGWSQKSPVEGRTTVPSWTRCVIFWRTNNRTRMTHMFLHWLCGCRTDKGLENKAPNVKLWLYPSRRTCATTIRWVLPGTEERFHCNSPSRIHRIRQLISLYSGELRSYLGAEAPPGCLGCAGGKLPDDKASG